MDRMLNKIILLIVTSVTLVSAGEWISSASLNVPRAGASAVTWNGKIYVFGGKSIENMVLNTVEVYDPQNNTWDSTYAKSFDHPRYNASAIVWQDMIYLIGGSTNDEVLDIVEIYDPVQNSWEEAHELREERQGHSTSFFNGTMFTIGGQREDNFHLVDDIEWYDADDEKWEKAEFELEDGRSAHFAEVYSNEYYMFGGFYFGALKNTIFKAVPDSEDSSWVSLGTLSEPRAYGATAQIDSLIYIIGGETTSGKTKRVEVFNAKTGNVSVIDDMNMAFSGMASAVLDGDIYVIGGFEGTENDIVDHVHVYDMVTAIDDKPFLKPTNFLIANVYPNPFNGRVKIDINLPLSEIVQIDILNILGQKIRPLENRQFLPGKYSFSWDAKDNSGRNVSSGIYFVSLKTQSQNQILKITYVK